MVPRKFNIVDFDGFDLAGQYGEALPGIYDKIVDAHWNCVYIMCFGLKFGGFDIAPQYMTPEMFSDHIMLNGIISIDQNDVITIPSIEPSPPEPPEPIIIPGLFEENGTFNPPSGVDGYAPVTVNVSGLQLPDYELGVFPSAQNMYICVVKSNIVPSATIPRELFNQEYWYPVLTSGRIKEIALSGMFQFVEIFSYITDNLASLYGLTLLYNGTQGGETDITLLDSIENYSAVVLQSVYSRQSASVYNSSFIFNEIELGTPYYANMKDRNPTYRCSIVFNSGTTATLGGNKQIKVYGML